MYSRDRNVIHKLCKARMVFVSRVLFIQVYHKATV
jgi:hypothetical protein